MCFVMDMELLVIPQPSSFVPRRGCLTASSVMLLLAGAVQAQTAVLPEQHFPPGYLESVSTGYENGSEIPGASMDDLRAASATPKAARELTPTPLGHAMFLVPQKSPVSTSPLKKKHRE